MPARKESYTSPSEVELLRFVSLKEGAKLQGTSVDTIKRHQPDKIVHISPRRCVIRVRDALKIA